MRILGIDPGVERMGYGIAEPHGTGFQCIAVGCFTTSATLPASERLLSLERDLTTLLQKYVPQGAVIERLFFSKNTRTAFDVAEARGMILVTLARAGVPLMELSPQHVKLGVTGYGRATKRQVQRMVQKLFALAEPPEPDDAADALALAFTGLTYFRNHRP